MIDLIYHFIGFSITIYILIVVYYYCFKIYGIKATVYMNFCLALIPIMGILTGSYALADLELAPYWTLQFGDTKFFATDPITIFPIFLIIFEFGRYTIGNPRKIELTPKKIILISLLTTIYGIAFQFIIDPTAAALGVYYYRTPPPINIYGFPIWFITAFGIYGLFAFIFLIIERYYGKNKYIVE